MIVAKFIGMVIMFIPTVVVATVLRNVISGLLTPLAEVAGTSTFEIAMILLIPYLILVYCVFVSPIVNFWQTLRGRNVPGESSNYE